MDLNSLKKNGNVIRFLFLKDDSSSSTNDVLEDICIRNKNYYQLFDVNAPIQINKNKN